VKASAVAAESKLLNLFMDEPRPPNRWAPSMTAQLVNCETIF